MTPPRSLLRIGWAFHRGLHRLSGGRLSTNAPSDRRPGTLFLETIGRRSGKARRNGLFFLMDGESYVVVPSNAGAAEDPAWWLNLQANPNATVELGTARLAVRARAATPDEASTLWPRLDAVYPDYAAYRAATTRTIVPVLLEPQHPPVAP